MARPVTLLAITFLMLFASASSSFSAEIDAAPAAAAPAPDSDYERAIRKRADGVVAALGLTDAKKSNEVRDVVMAQYRALKDWHDTHDAQLKDLAKKPAEESKEQVEAVKATLKKQHDQFVSRLSETLTPEQVETVKNQMTYNVVKVTYDAFCQMLPDLTDEQKAKILETLKTAREEAMDGGSSEEKHAIFGRYKGRINNYLSSQGYDLKKASKEWAERQRKAKEAKSAQETTEPQPAKAK